MKWNGANFLVNWKADIILSLIFLTTLIFPVCADVDNVSAYKQSNWPLSSFSGLYAAFRPAIPAGDILCGQVAFRIRSCPRKLGEHFVLVWLFNVKFKGKYLAYTFQTVMQLLTHCLTHLAHPLWWAKGAESDPGSRTVLLWAFPNEERYSPFFFFYPGFLISGVSFQEASRWVDQVKTG